MPRNQPHIGPTARHARKTHCKNGHALTPDNVRIKRVRGVVCQRVCRVCLRAYEKPRRWLKDAKRRGRFALNPVPR